MNNSNHTIKTRIRGRLRGSLSLLALLALSLLATGCLRDHLEPCPPLRVKVIVHDKNYFNVDKVEAEQRSSETLLFREYVPTLRYTLRDEETGIVAEQKTIYEVEGDGESVTLEFDPALRHGNYLLTIWGGLRDENRLNSELTGLDFHPGNAEGTDIYLASYQLKFDYQHPEHTVEMQRTKGKLIVMVDKMPEGITRMEHSVTKLYGSVDDRFDYWGETHVTAQKSWQGREGVVKTIVAPTPIDSYSALDVKFLNADGTAAGTQPERVGITMRRNELTAVRYEWNPTSEGYDIFILINDEWERINGMVVD